MNTKTVGGRTTFPDVFTTSFQEFASQITTGTGFPFNRSMAASALAAHSKCQWDPGNHARSCELNGTAPIATAYVLATEVAGWRIVAGMLLHWHFASHTYCTDYESVV